MKNAGAPARISLMARKTNRNPAVQRRFSDAEIARRYGTELRRGILIGYWDEAERDAAKR